jgi:hypothetical protein
MSLMDGMERVESNATQMDKELAQLVSSLMTVENIELKSELKNPLNLTRLGGVANWCNDQDLKSSKPVIDSFILDYLKYMVSNKRQGRSEVVKAISEIKNQMKRTLMGNKEVEG